MKCDLCDKEFNNSEELKRHQEQVHPMDQGEVPDTKDENPEVKREKDNSEEKDDSEVEMPLSAERTR